MANDTQQYDAYTASCIAVRVASELYRTCERIEIVGSLRRQRQTVHDIDILLVPKLEMVEKAVDASQKDLFGSGPPSRVPRWPGLDVLAALGTRLCLSPAPAGTAAAETDARFVSAVVRPWPPGDKGKPTPNLTTGPAAYDNTILFLRVESVDVGKRYLWSDLPVDIYVCEASRFEMLKVIRTGSKEHNIMLAKRAKDRGCKLKADGTGLEGDGGRVLPITSEAMLFERLAMSYVEPEAREG